jgi:hypothetical protein
MWLAPGKRSFPFQEGRADTFLRNTPSGRARIVRLWEKYFPKSMGFWKLFR